MKRRLLLLLTAFCLLVILALLPLPIPPYLDFQVIYHADLGLLRGISIYDHAGQVNMIAQIANVAPEQVYVLPFPYPPWYALAALPLALLPIQIAARIWFELNLWMLILSVGLLTDGWPTRKRIFTGLAAVFFLPVLGSLVIGQYGFPVLLGVALYGHALKKRNIVLIALAAVLLTFKPHLGILILITGLMLLLSQRSEFGRHALMAIVVAGLFLFAIGFLASPLWPSDYFHSLTGFKDVSQCHQCNSLPMELAGIVVGGFSQAAWLAMGLLILFLIWLIIEWKRLSIEPARLVAGAAIVTLLVSPYLQNYDYVLLLVPLFTSAGRANRFHWAWLTLAYLLPFGGFGFFGVAGDVSLVISSLICFVVFAYSVRQLDGSPNAAYNLSIIE